MGKLETAKKVLGKKVSSLFNRNKDEEPDYTDKGLPLDIHIDSKISMSFIDLFQHKDDMKFVAPSDECYIKSYGKFDIATSVGYRFYFENDCRNYVLQIVVDEHDEIEECRLFFVNQEFFLTSQSSHDEWLDSSEGNIGWWCYPPTDDEENPEYVRVWCEDSDDNRVDPIEYSETMYLDRVGEKKKSINHRAFLYGKWIDDKETLAEFCLLTAKEYSDDSIELEIMCGVDVNPLGIKILF